MKRYLTLIVCVAVMLIATSAQASIVAVLDENAKVSDGLLYLESIGVTGLTLLAKEDVDTSTYDPSSAVDQADWTLSDSGRTGSWTINDDTWAPTYWFNKFDSLLAIYSYMGAPNPWSDSYNRDADVYNEATFTLHEDILEKDNPWNVLVGAGVYDAETFPPPNPNADTSHVSVYGSLVEDPGPTPVVPEPASFIIWGLLGTIVVALGYRRRRES